MGNEGQLAVIKVTFGLAMLRRVTWELEAHAPLVVVHFKVTVSPAGKLMFKGDIVKSAGNDTLNPLTFDHVFAVNTEGVLPVKTKVPLSHSGELGATVIDAAMF